MRFYFFGIFFILTNTLSAQNEADFKINQKFHPDSVKSWTKSTMTSLSHWHPGFYRYTSKKRFDYLIDSTSNTITDSLTVLGYYRKIKPLISQVGCLHTEIKPPTELNNYIDKTATLIPIEVFINDNKQVFITKSYAPEHTLPLRGEIVSINKKPIQEILNTLFRSIPTDGNNETEKILLLNHRFAFWYQTMIELNEHFILEVKTEGGIETYHLKGVNSKVFPSMKSVVANYPSLEFEVKDKVGILKIHSFAKSDIKRNGQHFKKFIKQTFKEIEKKQIQDLIIDLRYNTGGTDGNAVFLASYFFDTPFRYWDKIEVTEAAAKDVKGLARLFYRKPIKTDSSYIWKKSWVTNEFDYYQVQKPAKYNYKGQTYLLVNGLCMSSCSDFTAILSHNKKAKVVGQETGGGFQGNTSGMMPTAQVDAGLIITIPLQKYTNAVDFEKNFGRGTIPDYQVTPTLNDWMKKKDIEMEFALKLILEDK